ncbi:hypothetical protein [Cryptosporangium minutisporangium]|uniref:MFS transporter n=1 Tax=Cryptosporangium minutisporangium TaxID=113569 RepID=A0ABP6SZL2_9ACTN
MTSQGLLREARALVFVLVCLSLSVTLHSWAHGGLPPLMALLAGAGSVIPVAMLLTGRQRGLPVIAAGLAVTQVGLHGLFSVVPSADAHAMMATPAPGAMLTAHVVAGGLTALWLYAGEVAVWRLVHWLARRLPSFAGLFALAALRVPAPAPRRFWARLAELAAPLPEPTWLRSVVRRGPPRVRAVTS